MMSWVHVLHRESSHKYFGRHICGTLKERGRVELQHSHVKLCFALRPPGAKWNITTTIYRGTWGKISAERFAECETKNCRAPLSDLLANSHQTPQTPAASLHIHLDSSVEFVCGLCVLDFAPLETGQYKNSPTARKLTSKTMPWDLIAAKRREGKTKEWARRRPSMMQWEGNDVWCLTVCHPTQPVPPNLLQTSPRQLRGWPVKQSWWDGGKKEWGKEKKNSACPRMREGMVSKCAESL